MLKDIFYHLIITFPGFNSLTLKLIEKSNFSLQLPFESHFLSLSFFFFSWQSSFPINCGVSDMALQFVLRVGC